MNYHEGKALIKNFKDTVQFYKMSNFPDEKVRMEAKKEMMRIVFSEQEVLRFENEALADDNSLLIGLLDDFEKLLNIAKENSIGPSGGPISLKWTVEDIKNMYDLYKDDFDNEGDAIEFKEITDRIVVELK